MKAKEKEMLRLNEKRLEHDLDQFWSMIESRKDVKTFKSAKYLDVNNGNVEVPLNEIDFNKSVIFVSDFNILPFLSIYGLQKTSNVVQRDISSSGKYSRITKDYMYAEASEMRYASKASLDLGKDMEIPDMYKPELFTLKPIVIWRLNESIDVYYDYCCERIKERLQRGRNFVNWCFYLGSLDEFHNRYIGIPSSIPIYQVVTNGVKKVKVATNKDTAEKTVELITENSGKELF